MFGGGPKGGSRKGVPQSGGHSRAMLCPGARRRFPGCRGASVIITTSLGLDLSYVVRSTCTASNWGGWRAPCRDCGARRAARVAHVIRRRGQLGAAKQGARPPGLIIVWTIRSRQGGAAPASTSVRHSALAVATHLARQSGDGSSLSLPSLRPRRSATQSIFSSSPSPLNILECDPANPLQVTRLIFLAARLYTTVVTLYPAKRSS